MLAPGFAEKLEKVFKRFGRRERQRVHFAALPQGKQGAGVGVRPQAPIALGIFDLRTARAERLAEELAAAFAADDENPLAGDFAHGRELEQRLAVGAGLGGDHFGDAVALQHPPCPSTHRSYWNLYLSDPGQSALRRGGADEDGEIELL